MKFRKDPMMRSTEKVTINPMLLYPGKARALGNSPVINAITERTGNPSTLQRKTRITPSDKQTTPQG